MILAQHELREDVKGCCTESIPFVERHSVILCSQQFTSEKH
jgi:hypothetical protein